MQTLLKICRSYAVLVLTLPLLYVFALAEESCCADEIMFVCYHFEFDEPLSSTYSPPQRSFYEHHNRYANNNHTTVESISAPALIGTQCVSARRGAGTVSFFSIWSCIGPDGSVIRYGCIYESLRIPKPDAGCSGTTQHITVRMFGSCAC